VEAGFAVTTIATKLSALRRLLDAAVRAGALAANPAANVGAPRDRRDPGGAAARALQLSASVETLQCSGLTRVKTFASR